MVGAEASYGPKCTGGSLVYSRTPIITMVTNVVYTLYAYVYSVIYIVC